MNEKERVNKEEELKEQCTEYKAQKKTIVDRMKPKPQVDEKPATR